MQTNNNFHSKCNVGFEIRFYSYLILINYIFLNVECFQTRNNLLILLLYFGIFLVPIFLKLHTIYYEHCEIYYVNHIIRSVNIKIVAQIMSRNIFLLCCQSDIRMDPFLNTYTHYNEYMTRHHNTLPLAISLRGFLQTNKYPLIMFVVRHVMVFS